MATLRNLLGWVMIASAAAGLARGAIAAPTRVLVVPLDDRPVNYDYLKDLARIAGSSLELRLPPRKLIPPSLEKSRTEYDFEAMRQWLQREYPVADRVVISTEGFIYGSLVRSRQADVDVDTALARMRSLMDIIDQAPAKAYLFSNLSRVAPTIGGTQNYSDAHWKAATVYSEAADELQVLRRTDAAANAARIEELEKIVADNLARMPSEFLADFAKKRARDARVRGFALQLLSRVPLIVFTQEDCAKFGLHRQAKEDLTNALAALPPSARAHARVLTGLDEVTALLVARAYLDSLGKGAARDRLAIQVVPSDPTGLQRVSRYEDVSIDENLDAHIALFPQFFRRPPAEPAGREATLRLIVRTFGTAGSAVEQRDWASDPAPPLDPHYSELAPEFLAQLDPNDYILDLGYANGGDPLFLQAVADGVGIGKARYSSWNTTGNSMDLFAYIAVRYGAQHSGHFDSDADARYRAIRILDSAYQSMVRPRLAQMAKDRGERASRLDESVAPYNEATQTWLRDAARTLGFDGAIIGALQAELPWRRIFEVRVKIAE